jgi:hypothetical protein
MSAIPRAYRVTLSEQEFLETVSRYGIDCRQSGTRRWFYCPGATGQEVKGYSVSPASVVEFVRYHRFEGEPILKFICDKGRPSRIGLAYTEAGRRWRRATEQAKWAISPPVPRRYSHRSGKLHHPYR